MKDNARGILEIGVAVALAAAVLSVAGCGRSNKTADIAQDSILVKDADLSGHKVDTAAAATTLVRDRGSVADLPALTTGAPVKRATASVAAGSAGGPLQPPKKVYPSPVLPGRNPTPESLPPARIDPLIAPTAVQPAPATQPASPRPPRVIQPQPPTPPKTDSSSDSLRLRPPIF